MWTLAVWAMQWWAFLGVTSSHFVAVGVASLGGCGSTPFPLQLISKAMDFISDQSECEAFLADLELQLSSDHFERLQGQAYDAGTVMEEVQEGRAGQEGEEPALPPCEEVRVWVCSLGQEASDSCGLNVGVVWMWVWLIA